MKPTMEKLQKKIENKYRLCLVAARRAKMITNGAPPLVFTKSHKSTTIALEELLDDKLTLKGEPEKKKKARK